MAPVTGSLEANVGGANPGMNDVAASREHSTEELLTPAPLADGGVRGSLADYSNITVIIRMLGAPFALFPGERASSLVPMGITLSRAARRCSATCL